MISSLVSLLRLGGNKKERDSKTTRRMRKVGYGHKQLEEAIRRIKEYDGLKRIIVCTNSNLDAPKNYESVGFRLYDRKSNETESAYTGDYLYYEIVLGLEATGKQLASVAMALAQIPFHGFAEGERSNLEPIVQFFPGWTVDEADRLWCAAFVYYCCVKAGFEIPIRPSGCKTCHLAGCIAWEEFAMGDSGIEYHKGGEEFAVKPGDIVLYDRVFENREHDHIGIIVETREGFILVAEGNVNNRSEIIERPVDEHIRAVPQQPDARLPLGVRRRRGAARRRGDWRGGVVPARRAPDASRPHQRRPPHGRRLGGRARIDSGSLQRFGACDRRVHLRFRPPLLNP